MSVVTKNPFALLDEGDSKPAARPAKSAGRKSEPAREQAAPKESRSKREGGEESGARRGGAGARRGGGRGGRFPREKDDRHPRNNIKSDAEKQTNAAWGSNEGNAELKDEQAAEAIAADEKADDNVNIESFGGDEEQEEEEKQKTLEEYQAEQAEKRAAIASTVSARAANAGAKSNKKWATVEKVVEEEADYFAGNSGKKQRNRDRGAKSQVLEIDHALVEEERRGGGRGGFRGNNNGNFRENRGDREHREPREPRGDRPARGAKSSGRGGARGGERNGDRKGPSFNAADESAFPTLGA